MKFGCTLLFTALASVATALPAPNPPSPDSAARNTTLSPRGWDVTTRNDDATIWPVRQDNLHVITYCFATEEAQDMLEKYVTAAVDAWYTALGGPPSSQTGHSLKFESMGDEYCYYPYYYKSPMRPGPWNRYIVPQAVAIHYTDEGYHLSSTGYREGSEKNPGQHHMHLDIFDDESVEQSDVDRQLVADFTHELGHIIGLLHEHQRPDRDAHVEYRCYNLASFPAALAAGMADPSFPNPTEERIRAHICAHQDDAWSRKWGFDATNFVKEAGTPDTQYDVESIMHYDSFDSCADVHRALTNPWGVDFMYPLVALREGRRELIAQRYVPSKGDAEKVRKMYPWG